MSRSRTTRPLDCPFVGKGGLKLAFALEFFAIEPEGKACADLGCNVGGFTDCLLQNGSASVTSVDTGYGLLAWKLRTDPRVKVVERTNVLFWKTDERFDLIVIDLGWTRQERLLPVAAKIVRSGGQVLSLIKPSYEVPKSLLKNGVLDEVHHPAVLEKVKTSIPNGLTVTGVVRSSVMGSGGNAEHWISLKA